MIAHASRPRALNYVFPEDDLLVTLVDLYFRHQNTCLGLLHRPTFEQDLSQGRHHTDRWFAEVVLVVCAIGSFWSNDPRVFLENYNVPSTCGWKYFSQVQVVRESLLQPSNLLDIQFHCVRSLQHLIHVVNPAAACSNVSTIHRRPFLLDHYRNVYPTSAGNRIASQETWTSDY
jgi:hypothetical protein